MITYKGQLQIDTDGTIWFNRDSDGRCILRIQGIPEKKLLPVLSDVYPIDIRL